MMNTYIQAAIKAMSLVALTLLVDVGHAQAQSKPSQTQSSSAKSSLADHEARREKFKQLCANPTPSQRETLEIWAQAEGTTLGIEFCTRVEREYFGTPQRPRTADSAGFKGADEARDISPIQYFGGIRSFSVGKNVRSISSISGYTSLENFAIEGNKNTLDISVIANFKNLKTLSLRDTQVVSLEPLAALSNLETLNLMMDRNHLGLPGRTGLEPLRHLKNLTKLDITLKEPLGDQFKDLHKLESLVIYGPVKDVCSLRNLKKLTLLYLINSGVSDVACLKDLKELVVMDLGGNPIKSISELAPMPALTHLRVDNTLIEDLSAFTGKQDMFDVNAKGAPLRWCSPKTARDIKKGVSCLNPDGTEKPWWKRALRM